MARRDGKKGSTDQRSMSRKKKSKPKTRTPKRATSIWSGDGLAQPRGQPRTCIGRRLMEDTNPCLDAFLVAKVPESRPRPQFATGKPPTALLATSQLLLLQVPSFLSVVYPDFFYQSSLRILFFLVSFFHRSSLPTPTRRFFFPPGGHCMFQPRPLRARSLAQLPESLDDPAR